MGRFLSAASAVLFLLAEIAQLCWCANSTVPCIERERQALLKFKATLHDPSNWLSSWKGDHCCQWEGIGCDNVTGYVVKLDLSTSYSTCLRSSQPNGNLYSRGECQDFLGQYVEAPNVNPSLSQLEYLTYLDLTGNDFHGSPIPMFIDSMRQLTYLSLSSANFRGKIPSSLGNLTNLRLLDLSRNYGLQRLQTNDVNWISKLRSLEHLDLSEVDLGEAHNLFQVLTMLPSLLRIYLADCGLDKSLVPLVNLSTTAKFQVLDLGENQLTVPILDAFQNMTSLVHLDLHGNNLNSVPSWLCNFEKLLYLDLSNNYLNGTIPQCLGQLVNLRSLYLSRNKLHGSIPANFGQLVNLTELDLSSNILNGTIFIGQEWSSIMPLSSLNLSYNQFSGSLPKNIGDMMPQLSILLLSNNLINGSIPNSLCQIYLYYLDLSKNNLSGEIPNCWGDYQGLEEINFSSNKLSGVFPSSFGNLYDLAWLHLSNNNLQGQLPVSPRNLKKLKILDIGENQLSGSIPPWTTNIFPSLEILRLRQNMLNGSIPSHLCQFPLLQILDISLNNLTGSIPWCIGNLSGMTSHKSYTELTSIPTPVYSLYRTRRSWSEEDAKTVMKGREYDYIKILKLVVNMDLSCNNLVGFIPQGITSLRALIGLNLSNNHLKGEIPMMIGDMNSLESFDVSNNLLSGPIPNSMTTLTFLSHLNLSCNNFSGPIPTGNQFLTYVPSVYADNPYLCGPPLLNNCSGDGSHLASGSKGYEDEDSKKDESEKVWFCFVIAVGFATGFWGVIGTLSFKKSWRHAYFRWVEDAADRIYVSIVIKVAKLKKWMVKNRVHE